MRTWISRFDDVTGMRGGLDAGSTWHDSTMFLFYIYTWIYKKERKKERKPFSGQPSFGRYLSIYKYININK